MLLFVSSFHPDTPAHPICTPHILVVAIRGTTLVVRNRCMIPIHTQLYTQHETPPAQRVKGGGRLTGPILSLSQFHTRQELSKTPSPQIAGRQRAPHGRDDVRETTEVFGLMERKDEEDRE